LDAAEDVDKVLVESFNSSDPDELIAQLPSHGAAPGASGSSPGSRFDIDSVPPAGGSGGAPAADRPNQPSPATSSDVPASSNGAPGTNGAQGGNAADPGGSPESPSLASDAPQNARVAAADTEADVNGLPEPSSMMLLAFGAAAAARRYRQRDRTV
jgi:hypothetical protein